jgi:diguanylate cyclase (GGDEF)-like protein
MRLFLDRNKTFLPRIDVIFLLTRVMTFLTVCWYVFYGDYRTEDAMLFYGCLVTYAILVGLLGAAMRGRFDLKLAYLGSILYDIVFLPLFVIYTGGLNSSFYLFFYLTVSVAAYVLTFGFAFAVTAILTVTYVFLVAWQITVDDLFGFSIRIGIMWVCLLALSYVSEYMRKSEQRLLKLFDTLNMRTSELEKSQVHLEMIYENTRILAAILEPDGVVREVMRIMGRTLQYTNYAIVMCSRAGEYYYRARCQDGHLNYHLKAIQVSSNDLVAKVSCAQEGIRVNDTFGREDYRPLNEKARSVIITPMTSHGQSQGLIIVESCERGSFRERDEQLLSVVARSAGLALENAELHKRTEELSIVDELTNSYNYRYFIQRLQEEKKRAVRYSLPLSIIMVDIDRFKKLNDRYGHEVGNIVLRSLTRTIRRCVRDVDVLARYGGEEFVVILPQTPQIEAHRIGERIREQVEATNIDAGSTGIVNITVSVGVSSYPENGKSEEDLVSVADQALYRAKGSGRNLVCVA